MTPSDHSITEAAPASHGAEPAAPGRGNARLAHPARDALADGAQIVREQAGPALRELAQGAGTLARESAGAAGQRAVQMRDASAEWIRERPLQAMLIAAATGATVVLQAALLSRVSARRV